MRYRFFSEQGKLLAMAAARRFELRPLGKSYRLDGGAAPFLFTFFFTRGWFSRVGWTSKGLPCTNFVWSQTKANAPRYVHSRRISVEVEVNWTFVVSMGHSSERPLKPLAPVTSFGYIFQAEGFVLHFDATRARAQQVVRRLRPNARGDSLHANAGR